MDAELRMLDTVIATTNFPEYKVLAGDLGTVVEIYSIPDTAYEVEFVNPDGCDACAANPWAPAGTFTIAGRCVDHSPVAAGGLTSRLPQAPIEEEAQACVRLGLHADSAAVSKGSVQAVA